MIVAVKDHLAVSDLALAAYETRTEAAGSAPWWAF
jgi:hypothetical protein